MAQSTIEEHHQELLRSATAYASRGWPVFPLHSVSIHNRCSCGKEPCESAGKHPLTPHGFQDATTELPLIRSWWAQWPAANIGIATGLQSGIAVLDIDPRNNGDDSVRQMQDKHGSLPQTITSLTGGGGEHYYFLHPGGNLSCRSGLVPGVDFKGDGGYVVAPPSRHQSGRKYVWSVDGHPDEVALASIPTWLLELVRPSTAAHPVAPASHWAELIRDGVAEGKRNTAVASHAGHLVAKKLHIKEVRELLLLWNTHRLRPPLQEAEIIRVLTSIAEREMKSLFRKRR